MIPVEGTGWSCLPAELLLRVFDTLEEVDFVSASSTCSNWRRVFHLSSVWKRRVFDLGKPSIVNLEKIAAFVACAGFHLKDLRIICSDTQILPPKEVIKFLDTLLSSLSNLNNDQSTVQCFHVENLKVHDKRNNNYLDILSCMISLAKFIQQQSNLEQLHLESLNVEAPFDKIIFESIVKSHSFTKLKVLHIVDFPCSCFCIDALNKHGLRGCSSLEELALNYSLLSAIKFDHLWCSFGETLKVLSVYCSAGKDAFPAEVRLIKSSWWRQLGYMFPRLQVFLTINKTRFDVLKYLVEDIPLVCFSWSETICYTSDSGALANKFLGLLAQFYSQTLRSVRIDVRDIVLAPLIKERVYNLVRSCPNLTEISFSSGLINIRLLEEIQASVVPRANNVGCVIRII